MTRTVQIFIEAIAGSGNYKQIELFKDEKINTSLSTQNIADISKIYTDFTQSFTVPCSPINNAIFKHFYNGDLDVAEDFGVRRNAYIEIDYTPFRSGRIQLEDSVLTNNRPEFYTITFYGDILSLKDTFQDDKLNSLDYTNLLVPSDGIEIKNRVTDGATNYDVRFPLISSKRLWSYGDAANTDVSTTDGAISYQELSPAVKVSKIFAAIETKYNIDFQGLFLTNKRFTNCFLECKNGDKPQADGEVRIVDWDELVTFEEDEFGVLPQFSNGSWSTPLNQISYGYHDFFSLGSEHVLILIISVMNASAIYTIDVYDNGVFSYSITDTGSKQFTIYNDLNSISLNRNVKFTVRTDIVTDVRFDLEYSIFGHINALGMTLNESFLLSTAATSWIPSSVNFDLAMLMPDMTIIDFFSGVLKQFNLTCYAIGVDTFQIEPLDDWYAKGAIRDITQYVSEDSITIERVKRYKTVSFQKQPSESFMNREYKELFNEEYGDLMSSYPEGEGEYNVSVPFENLMFQKFTGTNLQVGYCLTKAPDFKPYVPKPILLYMYDSQACSFKFFDGTNTVTVSNYQPFGQDVLQSGIKYSLNWGSNTSTLHLTPIDNSIFKVYYSEYLKAIFNKKNRIVKVNAIFPISLITKLRLNDRLIIRDIRYIINEINTDITSGDVKLVLIKDFRAVKPAGKVFGGISKGGGSIGVSVMIPNKVKSATLSTTTTGVTLSTASITADTDVIVTAPANPDPLDNLIGEDSSELIGETLATLRSENGTDINILIDVVYTQDDDTTYTEVIEIPQEA
jgi:hypothetical protein